MNNTTYRLDDAEERLFSLYAHALEFIGDELSHRGQFNVELGNDVADYAICNTAVVYYKQYHQVPSPYMVHQLGKAMIKLLHDYAPQYRDDLIKIVQMKEATKKPHVVAQGDFKKPQESDPTVGNVFYETETTTKS